jgi:sulfate permease, SulP family
VAGLTVTAILIPEGMAYAQLAGVDPKAAFYAAAAALLFSTSVLLAFAVIPS